LFVVAAVGLPWASQPTENPFAGDEAAIAEGRGLLEAVCAGYCHAIEEGESTDAPDLFDCEWWHGETDADLFGVIRDGVPNTRMQGFGGQFPDEDLWRVIASIRADSRCREDADQPG
jgi:mono/diheme cytochrome c family protein